MNQCWPLRCKRFAGQFAHVLLGQVKAIASGDGLSVSRNTEENAGARPMRGHDLMTKAADCPQILPLPPLSMPIEEAIRTQRALRRLKPDPVDDALVLRLIELALKAPTGRNAQNWEFVLVKDRTVKARLARLYRISWSLYGRLGRHLTASDPNMQRQLQAVQ